MSGTLGWKYVPTQHRTASNSWTSCMSRNSTAVANAEARPCRHSPGKMCIVPRIEDRWSACGCISPDQDARGKPAENQHRAVRQGLAWGEL